MSELLPKAQTEMQVLSVCSHIAELLPRGVNKASQMQFLAAIRSLQNVDFTMIDTCTLELLMLRMNTAVESGLATAQILDDISVIVFPLTTALMDKKQALRQVSKDSKQPPKWAEYLLYFLPKDRRESAIGDLEELYGKIYKRHGKRKAQLWCAAEVARSFWPLISSAIKRLAKWGLIGGLGRLLGQYFPWEWVRRFIS
jgi:hypothetical protein